MNILALRRIDYALARYADVIGPGHAKGIFGELSHDDRTRLFKKLLSDLSAAGLAPLASAADNRDGGLAAKAEPAVPPSLRQSQPRCKP